MERALPAAGVERTHEIDSAGARYENRFRLWISSGQGPVFFRRRSGHGSARESAALSRYRRANLRGALRRYPVAARAWARSEGIQKQSGPRGSDLAGKDRLGTASVQIG